MAVMGLKSMAFNDIGETSSIAATPISYLKKSGIFLSTGSLLNPLEKKLKYSDFDCIGSSKSLLECPLSFSTSTLDCSVQYSNGTTPTRCAEYEGSTNMLKATRSTLVSRLCPPNTTRNGIDDVSKSNDLAYFQNSINKIHYRDSNFLNRPRSMLPESLDEDENYHRQRYRIDGTQCKSCNISNYCEKSKHVQNHSSERAFTSKDSITTKSCHSLETIYDTPNEILCKKLPEENVLSVSSSDVYFENFVLNDIPCAPCKRPKIKKYPSLIDLRRPLLNPDCRSDFEQFSKKSSSEINLQKPLQKCTSLVDMRDSSVITVVQEANVDNGTRVVKSKSDVDLTECIDLNSSFMTSSDSKLHLLNGYSAFIHDCNNYNDDGGLQDLEYHLSNDATHELQDIDEERSCLRRTRSEMVRSRSTSQSLSTHPKFCFGRQFSTPQPMKMKHVYAMPEYSVQPMDGNLTMKRSKGSAHLRRSVSQPLDLDKSFNAQVSVRSRMATRMTADRKKQRRPSMGNLLSEDESSADEEPAGYDTDDPDLDGEVSVEHRREYKPGQDEATGIVFAEALWDHVSLDAEELVFKAGDLITVVDYSDPNWWWGKVTYRSGWFPASFVRLLVNQEDHEAATEALVPEEHTEVGEERWSSPRKASVASMSHERVRANVIVEIIATERDYVKHLNDLAEGYLKQMRRRPDMFTSESIATIFGNVETLFAFHVRFLAELESCIEYENPHNSCIGRCFIENKTNFEIYSDYCNNHPSAVLQLQEMFQQQKYVHFFEACRLLQEMIDISLDGFLLTPVQKICKYPLQLQELLKYTSPKHHDYAYVHGALQAMKEVATLVNERRRRTESLEKIAKWQREVEGWVGPDLLEVSSQLIHQGEATKGIGGSWPKEVIMFLFDHQLIYCKKDLLKRRTFVYRGRINTDLCEVADIHDEAARVAGVQHAWKIHCLDKSKTYVFTCKSAEEKEKWLQAFRRERTLVALDEASGYVASELQKDVARLAAKNQRLRPKKPRVKRRTRKTMTYAQARRLVSAERPRLNGVDGVSGDKRPPDSDSVAPEMTKKKSHHWFIFGGSRKTRAESHGRAAP